jgi:predicted Zn-dependent protease
LTGTIGVCYFAFLDEAPLTGRKRWIATSPAFEHQLGDQEYRNLLRQFRSNILPPQHQASRTVERVGNRIALASKEFADKYGVSDISDSKFTYTVVRSDQANAFVLPNNHVFVLTGLFQYVRDEDELAAVLGHEAAHTLARHAGERMSSGVVVNLIARLLFLVDPSGVLSTIFLPAASLLSDLPHSREAEREADRIGIYLASIACYDPRASKRVFARMAQGVGQKGPPEFLSTHPAHESRIQQLDQWIPDAMKAFERDDFGATCRDVRSKMAQQRQMAATQAMRSEEQRYGQDW